MLGLEPVVELLGDAVSVKGVTQTVRSAGQVECLFLIERDVDLTELLDQGIARLVARIVGMLTVSGRADPGWRATHCQIWVDFASSTKMIRCS